MSGLGLELLELAGAVAVAAMFLACYWLLFRAGDRLARLIRERIKGKDDGK